MLYIFLLLYLTVQQEKETMLSFVKHKLNNNLYIFINTQKKTTQQKLVNKKDKTKKNKKIKQKNKKQNEAITKQHKTNQLK
jgi:transcriptional antiterminator